MIERASDATVQSVVSCRLQRNKWCGWWRREVEHSTVRSDWVAAVVLTLQASHQSDWTSGGAMGLLMWQLGC